MALRIANLHNHNKAAVLCVLCVHVCACVGVCKEGNTSVKAVNSESLSHIYTHTHTSLKRRVPVR